MRRKRRMTSRPSTDFPGRMFPKMQATASFGMKSLCHDVLT